MLLQAQRSLVAANETEAASLLAEVDALLPFRERRPPSVKSVSQKLDLCQVIMHTHRYKESNTHADTC